MTTDIKKLTAGRALIESYWKSLKFKGRKTTGDIERMFSGLKSLGFADTSAFFEFNLGMNLKEADRCMRFRTLADDNQPAVCDNCAGRCNVMCITSCASGPEAGQPWIDGYYPHTPESAIVAEQHAEASRLGIAIDFVVVPIIMILCHDISESSGSLSPGFCTGKAVQIVEPQFDWLWGMESYRGYGARINENMKRANEV